MSGLLLFLFGLSFGVLLTLLWEIIGDWTKDRVHRKKAVLITTSAKQQLDEMTDAALRAMLAEALHAFQVQTDIRKSGVSQSQ